MIYALIALAFFLIASYTDLKKREVPELLTTSLIALGIGLHAIDSIVSSSTAPIAASLYMTILAFAFSYFLYKIGAWAGGDVKLFTGLGAILPTYGNLNYFPFLIFAVSFLAALPFIILYIGYFFVTVKKLREIIKPILVSDLKKTLISAIFFVSAALAGYLITNQIALVESFLFLFLASFIMLFGIHAFGIAKEKILRKTIAVKNLEEGMIPAEDVVIGKTKIADSRLARGLTWSEIKGLKKVRKSIKIKLSIPFVPILTLGMILLLLLEKVIK
jgi:Flp pilus assembly protein protease CpaA